MLLDAVEIEIDRIINNYRVSDSTTIVFIVSVNNEYQNNVLIHL
jgi:hypothetical protein